jgi:hypothetical protein
MANRPTQAIERLYERSATARALLFAPALLYRGVYKRYLQSDYDFVRDAYYRTFDRFPDLETPATLNEKIQWRKLYDRNPAFVRCTDKYRVRAFVAEKVGQDLLVPLLLDTTVPDRIDFEAMPRRFVAKVNHGCGWNELVWDKHRLDRARLVRKLKGWLGSNFYYARREWQYRDIEPRVLVETMLVDDDDRLPTEYRFFCFDGAPTFLEIVADRFTDDLSVDYYDLAWTRLPVLHDVYRNGAARPQPDHLAAMRRVAARLSAGFDFVRVDLYLSRNRIYFGELTFTPGAGFLKLHPPEYDAIFGRAWRLPPGVRRQGRRRRRDGAGALHHQPNHHRLPSNHTPTRRHRW